MTFRIKDIIKVIEKIAPLRLAEKWDNTGMQVGHNDWPVQNIWVALDPLPEVIDAACQNKVDLLITHHPLIFQPIKSVDFSTSTGSIIQKACQHKLAIISAHTNYDNAQNGMNDILSSKIGLKSLKVLNALHSTLYKLVIFLPVEYETAVLNSFFETTAGVIGKYSCCSFRSKGKGTFKPHYLAKPFIGKSNEISNVEEVRLETIVKENDLEDVINQIKKVHPYEKMAYDVYKILDLDSLEGTGRVGKLENNTKLSSFALEIKKKLNLSYVNYAGNPDLIIEKVAVCAGSGASLLNHFFSSGAQVYVSGDFKYHDARAVQASNLGLIDIGHFASELIFIEYFTKLLEKKMYDKGIDVNIKQCTLEKDPFMKG